MKRASGLLFSLLFAGMMNFNVVRMRCTDCNHGKSGNHHEAAKEKPEILSWVKVLLLRLTRHCSNCHRLIGMNQKLSPAMIAEARNK